MPLLGALSATLLAAASGCGVFSSAAVEVEVKDGSTYAAPQEAGVLNTQDGTDFVFNTTIGGMSAVVRFRVGANGNHELELHGKPGFTVDVRLSQSIEALASLSDEGTAEVTLSAETDYYLEIEQSGGAILGSTRLTVAQQ